MEEEISNEKGFLELLPFLANVRTIAAHRAEAAGLNRRSIMEVAVADGHARLSRGSPPSVRPLIGKIIGEKGRAKASFAGVEILASDNFLNSARDHKFWPTQLHRDELTLEEETIRDKSLPHAAVALMRGQRRPQGTPGSMNIRWAVYLPLDEFERTDGEEDLDADYTLLLHGCFFVDAGRRHVKGLQESEVPKIEGDDSLRRAWNVNLRDAGTLPLIPRAFEEFNKSVVVSWKAMRGVCAAFRTSRLWGTKHHIIARRHSFVLLVGREGAKWTLVSATKCIRSIPEPPEDDFRRPWDTLPGLEAFSESVGTTYHKAPNLRSSKEGACDEWTATELADLLGNLPEQSITTRAKLDWLCDFMQIAAPAQQPTAPISAAIVKALRKAIVNKGAKAVSAHAKVVAKITAWVRNEDIVYLSETAAIPRLLEEAARDGARVLMLRSDMKPDDRAEGRIGEEDGLELLELLDRLVREDGDVGDAACQAAMQVFSALKHRPERPIGRLAELKVLRARDEKIGGFVAVSWLELLDAAKSNTLFVRGGPKSQPLTKHLQQALPSARILTAAGLPADWGWINAGPVGSCDEAACLRAITNGPPLGDEKARAALASLIVNSECVSDFSTAMRYLIHGNTDKIHDLASVLLKLEHPEIEDGARRILQADGWKILPTSMSNFLSDGGLKILNARLLTTADFVKTYVNSNTAKLLDGVRIEDNGRNTILSNVNNRNLWRLLPLHKLHNVTHLSGLDASCFLDVAGRHPVPPKMKFLVKLVEIDHDETRFMRQREWIEHWGPHGQIFIGLTAPAPADFAREILDALEAIEEGGDVDDCIDSKIGETKWLPCGDRAVAPRDVVMLDDAVLSSAEQALEGCREDAFAVKGDLDAWVTAHPGTSWVLERFSPSKVNALERLAKGIADVGGLEGLPFESREALMVAADYADQGSPELPLVGWPIFVAAVKGFGRDEAVRTLKDALSKAPEFEDIILSMATLSETETKVGRLLFVYFLKYALKNWPYKDVVDAVKFPNQHGKWLPSSEIAVMADGIEGEHILHHDVLIRDQELKKLLQMGGRTEGGQGSFRFFDDISQTNLDAAPRIIGDYFKPWVSRVPKEAIGVLVALLGDTPDWRHLADEYLSAGKRSVDGVRAQVEEASPDRLVRTKFAVRVHKGERAELTSISGVRFEASLKQKVEHIFADQLGFGSSHRMPDGTWARWMKVRHIDVSSMDRAQLQQILQKSLELILVHVYQMSTIGRSPLVKFIEIFAEISKGNQIDIATARRRVVDVLEDRLAQLKIHSQPPLADALRQVSVARTQAVEVADTRQSTNKEAELDKSRHNLAALFESDASVRSNTLNAIRRRIEGDFDYSPSRVPYELFQNADDAVVELLSARSEVRGVDEAEIKVTDSGTFFTHFGRPVNDTLGLEDAPGYNADLDKMLLIAFSDKSPETGTTGRFGFGFKCVHLVTDQPHIASGLLRCDILGGMLPIHATHSSVENLLAGLPQDKEATVVWLPARQDGENPPAEYCADFLDLVGILTVFAKRIRSFVVSDSVRSFHVGWRAKQLPRVHDVEVGEVRLGLDAPTSLCLKFRLDDVDLLFRLDHGEVGKFLDGIPTIWSTAPTKEMWHLGYLINGAFRVDVGRSGLAGGNEANIGTLKLAGRRLGTRLVDLFDAVQADGSGMMQSIGVPGRTESSVARFWRTLFERLTCPGNSGISKQCAHALHGDDCGMSFLAARRPAVPTCLPGPWERLIRVDRHIRVAVQALTRSNTLIEVGSWPTMQRWFGRVVSPEVSKSLIFLGFPEPKQLTLAELVREILGDDKKVDPETAARLGRVVNGDSLRDMLFDFAEITSVIRGASFQTKSGIYDSAISLLAGQSENQDLAERSLFAPDNCLLSEEYNADGVAFFRAVRACSGFIPKPADLADWAHNADSDEKKSAVLRYLAGEYGDKLATQLRADLPSWIGSEADLSSTPLFAGLTDQERQRVLERLFPRPHSVPLPFVANLDDVASGLLDHEPIIPVTPETFFERLSDWWEARSDSLLRRYEQDVYPAGRVPEGLDDPESDEGRGSWFLLMMLGSFRTMGLAQDYQHRGFVEFCMRKGWWQTFVERPPLDHPLEWLRVLDEFAEDQSDDQMYNHWMRRFADFYRINRWLTPQANSILSIERRKVAVLPTTIMSPAADPGLARGGWSSPTFVRTLGLGYCFVVREAARLGAISGDLVYPHCWMPSRRVRRLLDDMGCEGVRSPDVLVNCSSRIADFVRASMPDCDHTFSECYDLPLQIVTTEEHSGALAAMLECEDLSFLADENTD